MNQDEFWGDGETVTFRKHGTVELMDFMGGDLQVVNSARQSFHHHHEAMEQGDHELIRYLMRNRHGTPFETSVFTFRIACPIFVAREWFRHRISSFNEMSGRYTEMKPVFFLPHSAREQTGKPGAYKYRAMNAEATTSTNRILAWTYRECWRAYQLLLDNGIAKEQARLALPVAIFTQFHWTVNARSLMNFLNLRLASNAMQEIRDAAEEVDAFFVEKMPNTARFFHETGVAP